MQEKDKLLSLKSHYRSGRDNLGQDFFLPCLTLCTLYKRAVGYFSSSVLINWAGALPRFAQGVNVSIKLLASPNLTSQDKESLRIISDTKAKDAFLQNIADQIILDAITFAVGDQTAEKRMRLFTWMVASEKLEIRFAFPNHVDDPGIFHEKIGIFQFSWGDKIAFTGSANESEMGLRKNYESIDIFRSWIPSDSERVFIKEEEFDEAWNGVAEGLEVKKLSKPVLEKIKEYSPDQFQKFTVSEGMANNLMKWRHQEEAIQTFLNKERGILEMATGTGKTSTALRICRELVNNGKVNTIVITMEGNDLMDQWYSNVLKELKNLNKRFVVHRHYHSHHQRELFEINPQSRILIVSRQELNPALRNIDEENGQKTLLIHDEVHGLGSPANRKNLSGLTDHIRYCLGLSATPEREYDEEGNEFILNHIGPTIYHFGIEEAIKRGILCPFNYHPIEYEPTDEDRNKVRQIIGRYNLSLKTSTPMAKTELWTSLANVYKTSESKIPLFREFIRSNQNYLRRCIIFVATQDFGEKILEIVHEYSSDFHTYFSGEDSETLKKFAKGELECLITCHRLSQGIDIQSLNNVILFSTDRAKLELIQRIGRCLRTDPLNPNKCANVVDFIRVRPVDKEDETLNSDEVRRNWLMELSSLSVEEGL